MGCSLQLPGDGSHHPAPPGHLLPPRRSSLRALLPALLNTGTRYSRLRVYQRDSAAQPAGKRAGDSLHLPFPPRERRDSLRDPLGGLRPPQGMMCPEPAGQGLGMLRWVPGVGLCLMGKALADMSVPREIAGCLSPLPPCLGGLVG